MTISEKAWAIPGPLSVQEVRVEDGGAAGIGGDQADNSVRDSGAVFVHRVPVD